MKNLAYFAFRLVPVSLLLLGVQQALVLKNIQAIYTGGTSYTADVDDFKIKHIASQTNGYVVVRFKTKDSTEVVKKLSLTVQLAARIMDTNPLVIKYLPGTGNEVLIESTYSVHLNMVRVNLIIIFCSVLITGGIAVVWRKRKLAGIPDEPVFEYQRSIS